MEEAEQYRFFRALDISVIELIVNQLLISKELLVDENNELLIEWAEFFELFCKIRDSSTQQTINAIRSKWHPVTLGYTMEKQEITDTATEESESEEGEENIVADDYTEDSASESSETSVSLKKSKFVPAPKKEPVIVSKDVNIHPVFMGYSTTKAKDLELQRKKKKEAIHEREIRAITKSRKLSEDRLAALEKQVANQRQQREDKIEKLKSTYDEATSVRKRDFDNNSAGMTEDVLKSIKAQFDKETATIEVAYNYELQELEKNHIEKSEVEEKEIEKKKEEVKMLKDAEKSIIGEEKSNNDDNNADNNKQQSSNEITDNSRKFTEPNAIQLEEFAKIEMNRVAKLLNDSTVSLQRVTQEYKILKEELADSLNIDKEEMKKNPTLQRKFQEAKSMLNIAETRLKEAAKVTKQYIEDLNDAEALLLQAQWRKSQEEELLPLFLKFMITPKVYTANKKKLISGLILLAKGNFEQKFELLLKISSLSNDSMIAMAGGGGGGGAGEDDDELDFIEKENSPNRARKSRPSTAKSNRSSNAGGGAADTHFSMNPQATSIYDVKFLLFFTKYLYDCLTIISLIPFSKADKDIENYIIRNFGLFSEMNGSVELITITEYEMKALLIKYIIYIHAEEIFHLTSSLYQIPKTMNLVNNFSNYSLLQSSSLSLMKYGIYDFATTARDIHYQMISYKNVLENNHKRDIHEYALSMGTLDPYKPDYSKFIIKQENSKSYYIIPHDNKCMTSSEFYFTHKQWKYVIKVQAYMRSYLHRKISWKIAKYKAYEEAKAAAIKQLKTKILKEFQKREQAKGLGKMKWDAEVRIKQAKLRTSGQSVNRTETVMILMEENIQSAKQIIEEKFLNLLKQENLLHFKDNLQMLKVLQKDLIGHAISPLIQFGFNCDVDEHMINPRYFNHLNHELQVINTSRRLAAAAEYEEMKRSSIEKEKEKEKVGKPPTQISSEKDHHEEEKKEEGNKQPLKSMKPEFQEVIPSFSSKLLDSSTFLKILKGGTAHDGRSKWDNYLEKNVFIYFSASEVNNLFYFFHRLKFLYTRRITEFKSMEIISEFPSKRLFFKYLTKNNLIDLKADLQEQFKFRYNLNSILKSFEKIILSDVDAGILPQFLVNIQMIHEKGLISIISNHYSKLLMSFNKFIDLRLESSNNRFATQKSIVLDEISSVKQIYERISTDYQNLSKKLSNEKENLNKLSLALTTAKEKLIMMENHSSLLSQEKEQKKKKKKNKLLEKASGKKGGGGKSIKETAHRAEDDEEDENDEIEFLKPLHKRELSNITRDLRLNWMLRYKNCLKMIYSGTATTNSTTTDSPPDIKNLNDLLSETVFTGMEELQNLLEEFQSIAIRSVKIILDELSLPDNEKTIPIIYSREINGRKVSQRGIKGKKLYFMAYNIYFYIYLDYDGTFNGSDEYAAKLSNQERLGSGIINDCFISNMMAPLLLTIDYYGYRFLASAKLPIFNILYNEDSTVKRISTEMIHGILQLGDNFINKNKIAYSYFKPVANKLNIIEHHVKGKLDFNSNVTYGALMKFYKFLNPITKEEEYYLRNCWNIFPHEISSFTNHLMKFPQEQSMFWRFLRPEYLLERNGEALSTDSGTILTMDLPDEEQSHFQNLKNATVKLIDEIIPKVIKQSLIPKLQSLSLTNDSFEYLITTLHKNGINIRHIGLMKSFLWRTIPSKCSIYHYENFIRISDDLSDEIEYNDYIKLLNQSKEEIYIIQSMDDRKKLKITSSMIPIHMIYQGDSQHEISNISICKKLFNDWELPQGIEPSPLLIDKQKRTNDPMIIHSTEPLRIVLLIEMIIRTMKNIIRYQLRNYIENNQLTSETFIKSLIIYYCNIITGNSSMTEYFFHEILFIQIHERFGSHAVRYSERKEIIPIIRRYIPLIIQRLMKMLGIQLSLSSMIYLKENPLNYHFINNDIENIQPKLKNNITIYPFLEAITIAKKGYEISKQNYENLILNAKPIAFFTLSERKGSKFAYNYGQLGSNYSGKINDGCLLEQSGPISEEKFLRSMFFHPSALSFVDIPYHSTIIPKEFQQHFSFQFYFMCIGGQITYRTLLSCGRYAIGINRDNQVYFTLYEEMHSIYLILFPVKLHCWEHVVITFDGTTIRIYLNSLLMKELEIDSYFYDKEKEFQVKYSEQKESLLKDQQEEIIAMKKITEAECTKFFVSKEGVSYLKRAAQNILDTEEFPDLPSSLIPGNDTSRHAIMKERKNYAIKKSKDAYIEETYQKNCIEIENKYDVLLKDLESNYQRTISEGKEHSLQSLRIGASHQDANSRYGTDYFYGNISCVSFYDYCLSPDLIRAHYTASKKNIKKDVLRIYHSAIMKFHAAIISFTFPVEYYLPYIPIYMNCLLFSLISCESQERNEFKTISLIEEISYFIDLYTEKHYLEPIVMLLNNIPRDPEFAKLIVKVILSIKKTDKLFLSKTAFINRQLLINLPFEFGLIVPNRPKEFYEAAAFIFQEVCRDVNYSYVYGDIDLKWITELSHDKLIISFVQTAFESKQLKIMELTKFYDYIPAASSPVNHIHHQKAKNARMNSPRKALELLEKSLKEKKSLADYRQSNESEEKKGNNSNNNNEKKLSAEEEEYISRIPPSTNILLQEKDSFTAVIDQDVQVISYHLPKLEGLDLSYFISLSDFAMEFFKRFSNLKLLILDECSELTDEGLKSLQSNIFSKLEKLSLERLLKITDQSILGFSKYLTNLQILNLNYCYQITLIPIIEICKKNPFLHTLQLSHCMIFDEDLIVAADTLKHLPIHSLDLSYCHYMTDIGFQAITESINKKLKKMNLKGNSRLSSISIQMLVNRCWLLEYLNCEDIYLLTDMSFQYNPSFDGRAQTLEKMLTGLIDLNLSNCDHLKDKTLFYLSEKCRKLESLSLANCYQITDIGLSYLMDPLLCSDSNIPLCSSLISLNLSYLTSPALTSNQVLALLKECLHLEKLDLSGLSSIVNDSFLSNLCLYLSSLQSLKVNFCIQLTNLALCSIAENLWLEELQISGCNKISSEGIEVLAETCLGLKILHLLKLKYISIHSIHFIQKNCPILQELLYEEEIIHANANKQQHDDALMEEELNKLEQEELKKKQEEEEKEKRKQRIYSDMMPSYGGSKRPSKFNTPNTESALSPRVGGIVPPTQANNNNNNNSNIDRKDLLSRESRISKESDGLARGTLRPGNSRQVSRLPPN